MILALLACRTPTTSAPPPAPTIAGRFGDWPFLTPIDAPPTVPLLAGGEIPTTAPVCGSCHPDHYAEWREATHAAAITDLQYLGELAKPGQPRWLCLNCHLPTRPQRADAITSATRFAVPGDITALEPAPEPLYDPQRVVEAVTCATCHVRRDDDGQGVIVGPRGSGRAPHRVRVDRAALDGVCERCHSPGPARLTPTFVCWFETRDELNAGPQKGQPCPVCHMPETTRPAAVVGPDVTLRRHLWFGAGVPKDYAGYDHLRADGFAPGLDVAVQVDPLRVSLTNARAGHLLPTADPERFVRVEVRALDAAGAVLGRDVVRIGQTWDWGDAATGRAAVRLADDRLKPGETRVLTPTLPDGADRWVVEVASVRLTPDNARYLATAALDAELTALRPDAPALLPEVDRHYPLGTVIWRGTVSRTGAVEVEPLDALLRESQALADQPLDAKEQRFSR